MLWAMALLLLLSSWDDGKGSLIGPIPPEPVYADSSQWFIRDRGGKADLFYIISTETGDHLMNGDTCHFADTYDDYLRGRMAHEMHAVDSFYSGDCNYYSPYYRQVSMQSALGARRCATQLGLLHSALQPRSALRDCGLQSGSTRHDGHHATNARQYCLADGGCLCRRL